MLAALHVAPSERGSSGRSTGVLGAEISLSLSERLGKLRLYQVEGGQRLSRFFWQESFSAFRPHFARSATTTDCTKCTERRHDRPFQLRVFEGRLATGGKRWELAPLSLLTIGIDDFKFINDRFGHPAWDEVLSAVARVIGVECRRAGPTALSRRGIRGPAFRGSRGEGGRGGGADQGRIASRCLSFE